MITGTGGSFEVEVPKLNYREGRFTSRETALARAQQEIARSQQD